MQALAAEQIQSFIEFQTWQKPGAINLDRVMESIHEAGGGGLR
jgi:hypothetical protein